MKDVFRAIQDERHCAIATGCYINLHGMRRVPFESWSVILVTNVAL